MNSWKLKTFLLVAVLLSAFGCARLEDRTLRPSLETGQSQQLSIASFNIRIFSDNSRSDEELAYIVDVLKRYDLIAVQELRDEKVLQRAVEMLKAEGFDYGYDISGSVGRGVKERYAFLYRKNKVEPVQEGRLYQEEADEFIREPFYATFRSGNFDFTLITIHVLFGKSKSERRPEIIELAEVYNRIQDDDPDEQDIILCGDFNFPPKDEGFDDIKSISGMTFLILPPGKTTITDTSLYDNFWFQKEYVAEYTGQSGIYKFDEIIFNNDDRKASLAVSDHRPIWAEFDTSRDDD